MAKKPKPSWQGLHTSDDGVAVNEVPDAEKFQRHCDQLEKKTGHIDPREMWTSIEDKPDHPVYPAYEWDDSVAGGKYRDEQSRKMIRSITVRVEMPDESYFQTRAIVCSPDPQEEDRRKKIYQSLPKTLKDKDAMEYQLEECLRGLVIWRRKWRQMSAMAEIAPQLEVVDGVIKALEDALAK